MKRINIIDTLRGLTIISMVLYHLFYDLVYVFGYEIGWYTIENTFLWQQSICISFIVISGISTNFTKRDKLIKNGIKVFILGLLITLITKIFMPEELIIFGILNFMGLAMVLVGLLNPILDRINIKLGIILSLILFCIMYKIEEGYLNLAFFTIDIPASLYSANLFYLGFPSSEFYSSDYFPLLPWIWLYAEGFFIGKKLKKENYYGIVGSENILSKIGKYSLVIYMLHQVVIYLILLGIDKFLLN